MAITKVDGVSGSGGNPPTATAFSGACSIGDLLIATVWGASGPNTFTVADTVNSGNYTSLMKVEDGTNSLYLYMFWKVANAAGTPTVSTTGMSNFGQIDVARFNGFVGTPTVDSALTNTTFTGSTTAVSMSPIVNNFANEVVLVGWDSGSFFTSSPSTYSILAGSSKFGWYAIQTSASVSNTYSGTQNAAVAWDGMVSGIYDAPLAGTKAAWWRA